MFATITDYFIISVVSDPVLQLSIAKKKEEEEEEEEREAFYLSISNFKEIQS